MRSVTMLSPEDKERVEAEMRRIVAEMRARPTADKEDALGLEIATMAPAEREYVPEVLLRMLAEETRLR